MQDVELNEGLLGAGAIAPLQRCAALRRLVLRWPAAEPLPPPVRALELKRCVLVK